MTGLMLWVFWTSALIAIAAIVGYPLLLALTVPFVRRARVIDDAEPRVALVIAAFNEESVIAGKLENSLELDYPRDKLLVLVASDGSTDRTDDIVLGYAGQGVRLERFSRTGKTGVQNRIALALDADVLVFSDANAMYAKDAIRMLVRNFADPEIGAVCGELVYRADAHGSGASESAYWRYERFVKRQESALSSAVGANGSIYAVRRRDYVQIDEGLISDLVEPLAIVRSGKRVVYEPEAVSIEDASVDYGVEYRRKVRILTRAIHGLLSVRELMNPLRYGVFALQLVLHKFLRFLLPLFLLGAALALAALAVLGRYRPLFATCVIAVLAAVILGARAGSRKPSLAERPFHLLYYFLLVNYALALAWLNVWRGNRVRLWSPERKRAP